MKDIEQTKIKQREVPFAINIPELKLRCSSDTSRKLSDAASPPASPPPTVVRNSSSGSRDAPKAAATASRSWSASSTSASHGDMQPRKLSLGKLLIATVVTLGVQVDWAVQAALLTPYLLVIGVPYKYYTLVCLCGPVSGLVVQPYMGVFSDHCHSRWGRRRPFILSGVILIVFGFMLIANATYLGAFMPAPRQERAAAMVAAIVGLWIIDMANNALAGPCRALIADIAPREQQRLGNALMAVWSSVGSVIGFMFCAIPWARLIPSVQSDLCRLQCADLRVVATFCAVCLLVTCFLTICTTHEQPLTPDHDQAPEGDRSPLELVRKIFRVLMDMPPALAGVCAFQFVSWWSWFHHTLFIAVWVGKVVNQGDGGSPVGSEPYIRYEQGLKAASLGFVLFAVLTGFVSMALPTIIHRFKTRRTLATAQFILACCFALTFLIPRRKIYLAAANIALFAIPWAVFLVIPYALIAQMAPPDQRGLYLGSLNIFACVPQVLVALSGPPLVKMFGDQKATQAALGFGAILALVSIALVPPLITKVRPLPVSTVATETDTIRPTATKPITTPIHGGGVERKEAEEDLDENLVEQPLLQFVREVSKG